MKHVLVVGGAGYIGCHIVDILCQEGYNVLVFDNLSNGYQENLNKSSHFIKGDITNKIDLENIFKEHNIETVIHMAAFKAVGESMDNPGKYTHNNIVGSLNLISMAINYDVEKFIFSSTAAVYGNPTKEFINEDHILDPINHYGFGKMYVENYLKWISKITNLKYVSLRYFNAAGYTSNTNLIKFKEKNPANILPIIMEVAINKRKFLEVYGSDYETPDGTCIRDYIHVNDLANAHLKSIIYLNDNESMEVNLSSGKGVSVLELIKITEKLIGVKIDYKIADKRIGDPAILVSSFDKALSKLGWSPSLSIEDIIKSMWDVYVD